MFDWLKNKTDLLKTEINKYRNKDMMEAVVAACAMVAYADGSVSSEEKQKMMGFMQQSEALKVFPSEDIIASFNKYVSKFEFDTNVGKGEALSAIIAIKNNPEQAQLLIRVAIAIANSDNAFDQQEKNVIIDICNHLNLDKGLFNL